VKLDEPGAVKVPLALTVNAPLISMIGLFVAAVTVAPFVPLPIVRSFDTVIVWPAAEPKVNVGAEATVGPNDWL
jgi:hypothetical protein